MAGPNGPAQQEEIGGDGMLYATVRQRKVFVKKPTMVVRNGVNVDTLILEMDDEWASMDSILCVFTLRYGTTETTTETVEKEDGSTEEVTKTTTVYKETSKEMLHTFGEPLVVPWECLMETGKLSISCVGYVGTSQIMRTMKADSFWTVELEGVDTGDTPLEPTPTLYDQILASVGAANTAAALCQQLKKDLEDAAARGDFDGEDGLPATIEIGTVQTGQPGGEAKVTNTGTAQKAVLNFVLPRGKSGADGTYIRDIVLKEETETGCIYTIVLSDGTTRDFTVPAGKGISHLKVIGNSLFVSYTDGTDQYIEGLDFLSKYQGSENAGKVLGIGDDGLVKPVNAPSGGVGTDPNAVQVVGELPPANDEAPDVVYLMDDETDDDKIQNVENAGKLLYVGPDGLVQTLVLGNGLRIVNGVLSITGTITPEETPVLFMDNGDGTATVQGVVFEDQGNGVVLMRGYNMEVGE